MSVNEHLCVNGNAYLNVYRCLLAWHVFYLCIYVCAYVYIYVCVYMYACVYVCLSIVHVTRAQ